MSGDGVISTDRAGKITMINQAAQRLTGWTHDEAIGKPLRTVFEIVNEQTGEAGDNPVDSVLRTGKLVELTNNTLLIAFLMVSKLPVCYHRR